MAAALMLYDFDGGRHCRLFFATRFLLLISCRYDFFAIAAMFIYDVFLDYACFLLLLRCYASYLMPFRFFAARYFAFDFLLILLLLLSLFFSHAIRAATFAFVAVRFSISLLLLFQLMLCHFDFLIFSFAAA